jgi:anti-sigma factor ChrR (cupin superfamily)
MIVNANFSRRVVVTPQHYQWVSSPQHDVERVMLDRLGGERARATSIVRYAPNSWFPQHPHPGGEEILVLSGTFSEGNTHYPAGWYLRNPPGSSHEPSSEEGAEIFVKLFQMDRAENQVVRIDTRDPRSWQQEKGRVVCPLFSNEFERVWIQRLKVGERLNTDMANGAEIFVLNGALISEEEWLERGSWIRQPVNTRAEFVGGVQNTTVYLKTGHLADVAIDQPC